MTTLSDAQYSLLQTLAQGGKALGTQGRSVRALESAGLIRKLPFHERPAPDHQYGLTDIGKQVSSITSMLDAIQANEAQS